MKGTDRNHSIISILEGRGVHLEAARNKCRVAIKSYSGVRKRGQGDRKDLYENAHRGHGECGHHPMKLTSTLKRLPIDTMDKMQE